MCHTDHLHTLILVSFFKHMIRNWLLSVISNFVAPVVSEKCKSLFFFIDTLILLWCCIDYIYLFYFIIRFIEHTKKGKFFLEKCVSAIWLFFIFSIYMNSLYGSYWPFIYIISHLLFQKSDLRMTLWCHWNRRLSSHKW